MRTPKIDGLRRGRRETRVILGAAGYGVKTSRSLIVWSPMPPLCRLERDDMSSRRCWVRSRSGTRELRSSTIKVGMSLILSLPSSHHPLEGLNVGPIGHGRSGVEMAYWTKIILRFCLHNVVKYRGIRTENKNITHMGLACLRTGPALHLTSSERSLKRC